MIAQIIVNPILQHAESFAKATFQAFVPFCILLVEGLIALWLAKCLYDAVILGEFDIRKHIGKMLWFGSVAAILITHTHVYWDYIYEPIQSSAKGLIETVSSLTPKSTQVKISDSSSMIATLENAISEVALLLFEICSKAGFFSSIIAIIISAIIWIAFVASLSIFCLYWVSNTIKLCALSALSPLLIVACLFEKTRGHAVSGVKYALTAILLLLIASFCMGLVLFSIGKVISITEPSQVSDLNLLSTLSTLFFVAWAAIYFLLLAPEMASVIMGSQNGSTLPGLLGGAIATGIGINALTSSRSGGVIGSAARTSAFAAREAVRGTASVLNSVRNRFGKNYSPETSSQKT